MAILSRPVPTPRAVQRPKPRKRAKEKRLKFGNGEMMTACIVGWTHSPFGKLAGETLESLIVRVAGDAIGDPATGAKDGHESRLRLLFAGLCAHDLAD